MSTALEMYDGREVIGCAIALTGAGDGLSEAMKVTPRKFRIGDRVLIVMEAEVKAAKHEPAVRDDLDGPLRLVAVMRARSATITDDAAVSALLDQHKAKVNKASEIEGQLSIEDDLNRTPELDDTL